MSLDLDLQSEGEEDLTTRGGFGLPEDSDDAAEGAEPVVDLVLVELAADRVLALARARPDFLATTAT